MKGHPIKSLLIPVLAILATAVWIGLILTSKPCPTHHPSPTISPPKNPTPLPNFDLPPSFLQFLLSQSSKKSHFLPFHATKCAFYGTARFQTFGSLLINGVVFPCLRVCTPSRTLENLAPRSGGISPRPPSPPTATTMASTDSYPPVACVAATLGSFGRNKLVGLWKQGASLFWGGMRVYPPATDRLGALSCIEDLAADRPTSPLPVRVLRISRPTSFSRALAVATLSFALGFLLTGSLETSTPDDASCPAYHKKTRPEARFCLALAPAQRRLRRCPLRRKPS